MTHSQWLHRCAVEHERDTQGLKMKEGRELMAAVTAQFALGVDGLHARNRHYIARETSLASEAWETDSMCACMTHWLAQA